MTEQTMKVMRALLQGETLKIPGNNIRFNPERERLERLRAQVNGDGKVSSITTWVGYQLSLTDFIRATKDLA